MNTEDQVAALFAQANPVPSLDLLDPIGPLDLDSLEDGSEGSGEMTDLKTIRSGEVRSRRFRLVPAMAALLVLVIAIPVLINDTPMVATPAEQVGNAYMEALNGHDGLAIRGMFSVEDRNDFNPDGWPVVTDFYRTLGVEYTDVDCIELSPIAYQDGTTAIPVQCSFTHTQDLMKAIGLEPTEGNYVVYVSDGDIVKITESYDNPSGMIESYQEFESWVQRNHPNDYQTMYFTTPDPNRLIWTYGNFENLDPAIVDPEPLVLWERYVDEFVADTGG